MPGAQQHPRDLKPIESSTRILLPLRWPRYWRRANCQLPGSYLDHRGDGGCPTTAMALIELPIANTMRATLARACEIPAGLLSVEICSAVHDAAAIFLMAAAMLNRLTLLLAPVARRSMLLYSFNVGPWPTWYGLVSFDWPTGAWITVRRDRQPCATVAAGCAAVDCGFDVLRVSDYDDRTESLRSIPAVSGIGLSFSGSRALHAGAFSALVALYLVSQPGRFTEWNFDHWFVAYYQRLVRADDLSRLNAAFYHECFRHVGSVCHFPEPRFSSARRNSG